jgi:DNA-binding transcriptional ArsR family regulator
LPPRRRKARRSKRRPKGRASVQQNLIKALNHPLRVKALAILSERTACPKEIAAELDAPVSNVSYHVRVLDELGLVEIVEEENVRGAVAHFYKSTNPRLIDNPAWASLDPKVRSALAGQTIEEFINAAALALSSPQADPVGDRHLTHLPLVLDRPGWQKVSEIQAEALARIREEQMAAALRIGDSEAEPIHVVLGFFLFAADQDDPDGTGEAER